MARRTFFPVLRWSTSIRLSLQYAALYTILSALVFYFAFRLVDFELTEEFTEQVHTTIANIEKEYSQGGMTAVLSNLEAIELLDHEYSMLALLRDSAGEKIAGNIAGLDWNGTDAFLPVAQIEFGHDGEIESTGFILGSVSLGSEKLIFGIGDQLEVEVLEQLRIAFALGFVLIALLGAATGILVGRRTEKQVQEIAGTLAEVSGGDIALRIPVGENRSSDLLRLSTEINHTLDGMQKLIIAQRQISTDIAHDLKTPLQRLRQQLESLEGRPGGSPELVRGVETSLDMLDDLMATFQAILRVSEIETGNRRKHFAPTDLCQILQRVEDAYSPVAEENGQTLEFQTCDQPAVVLGDSELLTQLIVNAVENALRHCPRMATIKVSVTRGEKSVTISVCDDGPGIPRDEMALVFDRFYRVDKSRSTSGNGLGLSLIKAVAELHGTKAVLTDNNPGLCLTVTIPAGHFR